eukprot:TRINITY_DN45722_c0_g1_i1.p1 TRINITY_DN45722_c0_g1~~TRINITY_DN45722_c0_g1_i1.p1  ORF type:complete len:408 (-),score=74.81 TRINITY_DN45722_c0_g1_i1:25-1248(-)
MYGLAALLVALAIPGAAGIQSTVVEAHAAQVKAAAALEARSSVAHAPQRFTHPRHRHARSTELQRKSEKPSSSQASAAKNKRVGLRFISQNSQGPLSIKGIGHFPEPVRNIGMISAWVGYGTKLANILYYTNTVPDDTLIVYVDGNDVVWGGCSKRQFLASYRAIVKESGAPVVVGAELVCGEQNCTDGSAIPKWALQRSAAQLSADRMRSDYTACAEQVKPGCRCDMPSPPSCRNFNYTGEDDGAADAAHLALVTADAMSQAEGSMARGPLFSYLNSGFVMGPAKEVRAMFQWAAFHYLTIKQKRNWIHDQGAIAEYWRRNPSKVTLDYRGELAVSLPRLAEDVLKVHKSRHSDGQVVRSELLGGGLQCFVHNNVNEWNGGSKAQYWWDFLRKTSPDKRDWDAPEF